MSNIKIQITSLINSLLTFEVTTLSGCENDSIKLDAETELWINSVFLEQPFKKKTTEDYSWFVTEVMKFSSTSEKRITIETRRGNSRLKKISSVPESIYQKFWIYLHFHKLPSELIDCEIGENINNT